MSDKFGPESKETRVFQVRGIAQVMTTGTVTQLASAGEKALDIDSAYFVITSTGTNTVDSASLKLGIIGDDDEFSATGTVPAQADQTAGQQIPMILGSDLTLEKGESMIGTTVTLANGPTGHFVVNLGVGNQA